MPAKGSRSLRGATEPRLHSPYLKGASKVADVIELAELINMPLLPWQKFCLTDMLRVDKKGQWIRKTNLLLVARQNGKTHLTRMLILAHLLKWDSKNIIIASSNRSMALDTFRQVAHVFENNENLMALVKQIRYANGTESIEMKDGRRLDVVAATTSSLRPSFISIDSVPLAYLICLTSCIRFSLFSKTWATCLKVSRAIERLDEAMMMFLLSHFKR